MARINPQPLRRTDDYLHGVPSLAGAAEIAPRIQEAGAVVIGHAYSPISDGTKRRSVRFTIVRTNKLLIDKTLYVYGDRVKGGAPKRFTKMALGYERALGGLDFSRNPVGVGMDKGSKARPNIIHPKDPKRAVGGYGPIPARFPRRRRRLGDVSPKAIESGILELPDDFDWEFFQAAPRDQRIARIRGDEWLMLEGMHPTHARVRVRIPKARALARLYPQKKMNVPAELELVCDTLHLEPDADRCSLVWRADFPIASALAASALVIAGTVQEGGEAIDWPATAELLDAIASPVQVAKIMPDRRGDPLFTTAVSPGGARIGSLNSPATERFAAGQPFPGAARRQQPTPPPPMPPISVPPAPEWRKVARPSWSEFQAVQDPSIAADPNSGVVSEALSSGIAGSVAYPSYPGRVPSSPAPAGEWSEQQAATQFQAPAHFYEQPLPGAPQIPDVQRSLPAASPSDAHAPLPPNTVASPTGTIPAPPPDDEVSPEAFHPLESTDEIEGEQDDEHPQARTDPLSEAEAEENADADWARTKVCDEES